MASKNLEYIPVHYFNNAIYIKRSKTYTRMTHSEYIAFRSQLPSGCLTISTAAFPFASNIVFESLLCAQFRLENLWRGNLLAHWHWIKFKTGIHTVYEHLDALDCAVADIVLQNNK